VRKRSATPFVEMLCARHVQCSICYCFSEAVKQLEIWGAIRDGVRVQ
jgi:hypothetical protein